MHPERGNEQASSVSLPLSPAPLFRSRANVTFASWTFFRALFADCERMYNTIRRDFISVHVDANPPRTMSRRDGNEGAREGNYAWTDGRKRGELAAEERERNSRVSPQIFRPRKISNHPFHFGALLELLPFGLLESFDCVRTRLGGG